MGLETGTTISSLITSNPTSSDPVSQGDDHIKLIKSVLQAQFPGSTSTGFNTAITATEAELNSLHNSGIQNLVANVHADASGNVGIGTSSPAGKLDVRGAAYFGTPNTFIIGDDGGSLGAFLNETAAIPMRFLTAGSEGMRISSAGNVGIGTTEPQNKLEVDQNSASSASSLLSAPQIYARGYAGGSTYYSGIGFAMHEHTNGYWGSAVLARDDTGSYGSALAFYTSTGSATPTPTEKMRITSAGGVSFGSSGTAYGSAGQVLVSNGDAAPAWGSSLISGAAQTASGATVSFTGIPSWAKRITVLLVGVTTVGSGIPAIRAGAGSYENTGYLGATVKIGSLNTTDGAASATTSWDIVNSASSSYIYTGQLVITKVSGNQYIISGLLQYGTNNGLIVNGTKTFSGNISQLQLLMSTGADTFNGGSINIMYE